MTDAFIPKAAVRLTLSDDAAIESILSDIPLFCVGLMAFGISTFFLVMRRMNLLAVYLFTSALVAFGSAILDLSQILARGRTNVDNGIDTAGVSGLVDTREVGLALSTGFRFLFFWTLVAMRPQGEKLPLRSVDRNGPLDSGLHSAHWFRWGYLGLMLKWSLLALTISIPLIQIIWRIAQRRYGVIYMVESTIEIVVSALFILKIMLNLFLSPLLPWWRPLRSYAAPLVGLLINLGIAVGNLISFVFSETTLGRFLQAVELYVLILFVLITVFHKSRAVRLSRRSKGTSSFAGLRDKPRELSPQTNLDAVTVGRAFSSDDEALRPVSTISRIGSWILTRNPARPVSVQRNRTDIEQGLESDVSTDIKKPVDDITEVMNNSVPVNEPVLSVPTVSQPDNGVPRGVSISSYYAMAPYSRLSLSQAMTMGQTMRDGSDSPVYGLNGIISQMPNQPSRNPTLELGQRGSTSTFDELLRQQTELDKSIAALKLFSPQTSPPTPEPSTPPRSKPPPLNRIQSTSTSSYIGQRLDSASGRSEFSLSIFPEPPSRADANPQQRMSRSSRAATWIPPDDLPSIPSSPNQPGTTPRYDSAATQYEITSFIGNLTVPGTGQAQSNFTQGLSDVESEEETSPTTVTASQPLRPILLGSGMPSVTSTPAIAPAPIPTTTQSVDSPQNAQPTLRPLMLTNSGPASPPRAASQALLGPRVRGRAGSASTRRLNISVPRPQDSDDSQVPDAFERPRPPPLILSPDKEIDG